MMKESETNWQTEKKEGKIPSLTNRGQYHSVDREGGRGRKGKLKWGIEEAKANKQR